MRYGILALLLLATSAVEGQTLHDYCETRADGMTTYTPCPPVGISTGTVITPGYLDTASAAPPVPLSHFLTIMDANGQPAITIDLKAHTVKLSPAMEADEAATLFWQRVNAIGGRPPAGAGSQ